MNNFPNPFSSGQKSLRWRVLVNTGALTSANLWRIVVSFLVQLLVARLWGLEPLGQYTIAMAYLNISQVLCEMGLPLWIVRRVAQAPALRRTYWQRGILLQGAASILLWALLTLVTNILPYPESTRTALFWVGASLPFFAITSATATIFQAAERMTLAFVVEFFTNLLILLASIWILWQPQGPLRGDVSTLLLVVVIAQGMGMLIALGLLWANRLIGDEQRRDSLPLLRVIQEAWPFFGLSLTDVLLQRMDILLLSLLGDARLIGIYSAAYNIVRVAVKLLQSVWRGVYPTLARLYPTSPEQAMHLATRLFAWGFAFSTLGALSTSVLSTPILSLVYGAGDASIYSEAATALAWLIWQAPLFFVELYATTWLMVMARAQTAFVLSLLHVLLLGILLPIGALFAATMGAVWGTLAAQTVAALATYAMMRQWLARPSPFS